ncbi:MAG: VCBS repeat-containing protein [Flavobacteriales bacterium]|nr:VCBS repeat-containing protein [Flavobacteriales bacterium]
MPIVHPCCGPVRSWGAITSQFFVPQDIKTADLDGDMHQDLVMRNAGAIVWSRNLDGQGTFGTLDTLFLSNWSPSWHFAFDLADIELDGDIDLVVLNRQDSLVVWLPNVNGLGSFGPAQTIGDLHGQGLLGTMKCSDIMSSSFPGSYRERRARREKKSVHQ